MPAPPPTPTLGRGRRMLHGLAQAWCLSGLALLLAAGVEWGLGLAVDPRPRTTPDDWRVGFPQADAEFLRAFAVEMDRTATWFDSPRAVDVPLAWEPFVYWRGKPFAGQYINVGADGARTTPLPQETANGPRERIVCLGGSTMWGFGARDEATIPARLAVELAATGHPAEVINLAQIGYVTSQEVLALGRELGQGRVPRAVVFLDGYNDIAAAVWNREPGRSLDDSVRAQEFLATRRSSRELAGWALRNTTLGRLTAGLRASPPTAGLPADGNLSAWAAAVWNHYRGQRRLVEAWAEHYGFVVLFAWQPVIYLKGQPSASETAAVAGRQGQAELCRAVYDWARDDREASPPDQPASSTPSSQTRYVYLGEAFNQPAWSGQTAFYDRCHLIESAQAEVAGRLARELAPLLAE